jgi:hypothetical protein
LEARSSPKAKKRCPKGNNEDIKIDTKPARERRTRRKTMLWTSCVVGFVALDCNRI